MKQVDKIYMEAQKHIDASMRELYEAEFRGRPLPERAPWERGEATTWRFENGEWVLVEIRI